MSKVRIDVNSCAFGVTVSLHLEEMNVLFLSSSHSIRLQEMSMSMHTRWQISAVPKALVFPGHLQTGTTIFLLRVKN